MLEVGAGLGGTTRALIGVPHVAWLCLEPDPFLVGQIDAAVAAGRLPDSVRTQVGNLWLLDGDDLFDTILYVDVLEHVAEDRAEVRRAVTHLTAGGRLVVLAPAHQWLFSQFDVSIGHVRRYTRATLAAVMPPGLICRRLRYADSVGVLASLANRLLLRRAVPSRTNILVWDRWMVPVARIVDRVTGFAIGKSVLGVWERQA